MKKYILFLLIPFLLGADEVKTVNGVSDASVKNVIGITGSTVKDCLGKTYNDGDGAVAYCTGAATCTATTPGQCDILCEDFEGSADCGDDTANDQTCRNEWDTTEDTGNGNVVIFDATPTNALCTDEGSYAAQITKGYTTSSQCGYKLVITEKANLWVQFYMNVTTQPATTGTVMIFQLLDGSNRAVGLQLGGADYDWVRLSYHDGSSTVTGTTYTIAPNTWYRVQIIWNAATGGGNNGTVALYVDGNEETNITTNNSTYVPDSVNFGNIGAGDTDIFTVQFDNIAVDDDTIQGACN